MCFAICQMLTEAFKNRIGQATSLYRSAQGADDGRWVVVLCWIVLSVSWLFVWVWACRRDTHRRFLRERHWHEDCFKNLLDMRSFLRISEGGVWHLTRVKRGTLARRRQVFSFNWQELMRLGGTIILSGLKQYSTIVNFKCRDTCRSQSCHE